MAWKHGIKARADSDNLLNLLFRNAISGPRANKTFKAVDAPPLRKRAISAYQKCPQEKPNDTVMPLILQHPRDLPNQPNVGRHKA